MAGTPVVAAITPYSAPVHINVGGTTYTSCLETLTKFPYSKLAKLFNGTIPVAVDPVKQQYFLDRDGKMFRHIPVLNFLRNSEMFLPDAFSEFDLLKKEAAYFEIEDLIKALEDSQQSNRTEEQEEQSSDDNTKGTCKTQLQGRERKRRKQRKKNLIKGKLDNEMLGVDTEHEFTQEEADLQKETLERNKSSKTIVSAKHLSTEEETNKDKAKSPVPDVSEVLQVHSSVETVVDDKELVCVVCDVWGGVTELWCSDKNFNLEIPETSVSERKLYACPQSPSEVFKSSHLIHISSICRTDGNNDLLGFPWIAKYLFKQGYKLTTSLGRGGLYHFFVK